MVRCCVIELKETEKGKKSYSLKKRRGTAAATKDDLAEAVKKLIWPPEFTRDINLLQMQKHLGLLNDIWNDPSLSATDRLIRSGEHSHLFGLANRKIFLKEGGAAASLLLNKNPTSFLPAYTPPTPVPFIKKEEEEGAAAKYLTVKKEYKKKKAWSRTKKERS